MKSARRDRLATALAGLCLATAAWAFFAPHSEGDSIVPPATPVLDAIAPDDPSVAITDSPAPDYAAILARPLFSPSRRPAVAVTNETTESEKAPVTVASGASNDHRLVGIVMIDKKRLALVQDAKSLLTERVNVGAQIGGWEITEVTANSATLQQGGRAKTLTLERKSNPKAAAKLLAQQKRREARRKRAARKAAMLANAAAETNAHDAGEVAGAKIESSDANMDGDAHEQEEKEDEPKSDEDEVEKDEN